MPRPRFMPNKPNRRSQSPWRSQAKRRLPLTGNPYGLPNEVRQLAEVVGREKALYIAGRILHPERRRCAWLYIPKKLPEIHPLIELAGPEDAAALVAEFGGKLFQIPPCHGVYRKFRDREIRRMVAEGYRQEWIAETFGVCIRTIRNLTQDLRKPRAV